MYGNGYYYYYYYYYYCYYYYYYYYHYYYYYYYYYYYCCCYFPFNNKGVSDAVSCVYDAIEERWKKKGRKITIVRDKLCYFVPTALLPLCQALNYTYPSLLSLSICPSPPFSIMYILSLSLSLPLSLPLSLSLVSRLSSLLSSKQYTITATQRKVQHKPFHSIPRQGRKITIRSLKSILRVPKYRLRCDRFVLMGSNSSYLLSVYACY